MSFDLLVDFVGLPFVLFAVLASILGYFAFRKGRDATAKARRDGTSDAAL